MNKNFCKKCGNKLKVLNEIPSPKWDEPFGIRRKQDKYYEQTGELNYVTPFICPKKRWWNFNHTNFFERVI